MAKKKLKSATPSKYGKTTKSPRSYRLPESTISAINYVAEELDLSTSDVIEQLVPSQMVCEMLVDLVRERSAQVPDVRAFINQCVEGALRITLQAEGVNPIQFPANGQLDTLALLTLTWRRAVDGEPGYGCMKCELPDQDGKLVEVELVYNEESMSRAPGVFRQRADQVANQIEKVLSVKQPEQEPTEPE